MEGSDAIARPYQLELLDSALEQNTVVHLATGAGKTFIAVMLIRELSPRILKPFLDEEAQRTVFLVPAVPLVEQQASYIRAHTLLNVGTYMGEMGVDDWPMKKWHTEFEDNQVLVMTMTIFKNLLACGYISPKKVNLIVFDECHHATKNHDYVQIMKQINKLCESRRHEIPRILGLSASIVPNKPKSGDIERSIKELEETLSCRVETARDLQNVAEYVSNPDEKILHYNTKKFEGVAILKQTLEEALYFLNCFTKKLKNDAYNLVRPLLEDCHHILENLGIWCAHAFAYDIVSYLTNAIETCEDRNWDVSLLQLCWTHLKIFCEKSRRELGEGTGELACTNKVEVLLLHLADSAILSGEVCETTDFKSHTPCHPDTRLLGIVFVERRTTAEYLCKLVKRKIESKHRNYIDLQHICCDYIVGHSDMNAKKQTKILEQFRRRKINLLFSTSVVEEGLDVPKCNLVVRFDFPQNLPSYIQSKGRARAKASTFLVLVDENEAEKIENELKLYKSLENEFKAICLGRSIPSEEEILKRMEEFVEPYMPKGGDGPIALLSSSLSLIHRYCQRLPSDRYAILAPEFSYEERESESDYNVGQHAMELEPAQYNVDDDACAFKFRCSVKLPMSSPVQDPIVGLWMPTKRIAQKSAALEAVKKLHEANELNDDLKPLDRRDLDSETEGETEGEPELKEKKQILAGTEKSSQYYTNEVAKALTDSFPEVGGCNYLYILLVHDVLTGQVHHSLSDEGPHTAFGILTGSKLPHFKIPEFSLYEKESELHVKVVEYHISNISISEDELAILKQFHGAVFTEILHIRPSWLKIDFRNSAKNYLIVPLGILPQFSPVEAFINMPLAENVAYSGCTDVVGMTMKSQWPCELKAYSNALVSKTYIKEEHNQPLFEVIGISSTSAESRFPDEKYTNFVQYFDAKYGVKLTDLSQPALLCKPHSVSDSRLKLLTSRFELNLRESFQTSHQRTKLETLFPEICTLYPIPADFWKITRCLPSILWRIECILSVDELRSVITAETGIGIQDDNSEITTHTNLRGYRDHGFGQLSSLHFTENDFGQPGVSELNFLPKMNVCLRGPDNALFLQALTSAGAMDSINLERLETLGDSFLKFVTTIFLFLDRPSAHEGRLTSARARRIGNYNLFKLAIEHNIPGKICSQQFEPRQMWIPPCFSFTEDECSTSDNKSTNETTSKISLNYQFHKVTDKGVADTVESLIGAYLVSGGIEAAIKFMQWMGFKIAKCRQISEEVEMLSDDGEVSGSSSDSCSPPQTKRLKFQSGDFTQFEASGIFFQGSHSILTKYFGSFSKPTFDENHWKEIKKLLGVSMGSCDIEEQINWRFKDRSLLLQALTHASYSRNRVTGSYQRLEFLGDAVLDYLVTCHIYSTFPKYGPGEISGMRSALVNNVTFAELAVNLKLEKALLHNSPSLFKHIHEYVTALKSTFEQSTGNNEGHSTSQSETEVIEALCNEQPSNHSDEAADMPLTEDANVQTDSEDEVEELDPPKVLGDILESLAGAVFLDSGMSLKAVWRVFQPLFNEKITSFKGDIPVPPIQELLKKDPSMKAERTGSRGSRVRYTVTVVNRGIKVSALASTPKAAKMAAARAALARLKKMD